MGVARQYCGSVGKVENCQVGVFAAYASPQRTKSRRRLRSRQKLLLSTSTNFSGINARLPKARKALWNTSLLKRRVTLSKNSRPDREVWLMIRRTLGSKPTWICYLSLE
ncbi:MAG: hypothetical protein JRI66_12500 [Deltaproteobacteria bacterium]|nr:hypothetical protein [Deltaproteobacteria bacterium]